MEGKERSKSKEIKIRNKARTSKFVVFDKHKVSNIRCSKNSSDCMIFKNVENKYDRSPCISTLKEMMIKKRVCNIKECTSKQNKWNVTNTEQEQKLSMSIANDRNDTTSNLNEEKKIDKSEASSDWIRIIEDSESTISYTKLNCENSSVDHVDKFTHESQGIQMINKRFKDKSNSEETCKLNKRKENHAQRYRKCMDIFKFGLMNLSYNLFEEFRIPQSGQHENARFAIVINESTLQSIDNNFEENYQTEDYNDNNTIRATSILNQKNTNMIKVRRDQKKRNNSKHMKRKSISDLMNSIKSKKSNKRRNICNSSKSRNLNLARNTQKNESLVSQLNFRSYSQIRTKLNLKNLKSPQQIKNPLPKIPRLKAKSSLTNKLSLLNNSKPFLSFHSKPPASSMSSLSPSPYFPRSSKETTELRDYIYRSSHSPSRFRSKY